MTGAGRLLTCVAESFDALLRDLYEFDESKVPEPDVISVWVDPELLEEMRRREDRTRWLVSPFLAVLLLALVSLASGCARDDSDASGSLRQSDWRLVGEVTLYSMAPGGVIEGVESRGGEMVAVVVAEGSPGGGRTRQMSIILDASSHGRPLRSPLGTVWILPQTGQSRHRFVLPSGHWDLIIEKAGPYAAQIRVYERIGGDESSPSPSSPAASPPRTVAPDEPSRYGPPATLLQPNVTSVDGAGRYSLAMRGIGERVRAAC